LRRFTPATILATTALFVALTGTATAGAVALITGKQIKNGSIGIVDLSAGARAALKGNRGPSGPAGLPGPAGVAGPAGPAGPPGVQSTKLYASDFTVTTNDGLTLSCPAGQGILTGGYFVDDADALVFSDHQVLNGWGIIVVNLDPGDPIGGTLYATCAAGVVPTITTTAADFRAELGDFRRSLD
jgi:hypothetical protein